MELHFCDPGRDYSLDIITEFQQSDLSDWWKDSLFHFYPQIDRTEYERLDASSRFLYLRQKLQHIYDAAKPDICGKLGFYSSHWLKYKPQIEDGCVYEYFYHMDIGGKPVLEILYEIYRQNDIKEFMKKGFLFCQEHEAEIRRQMI